MGDDRNRSYRIVKPEFKLDKKPLFYMFIMTRETAVPVIGSSSTCMERQQIPRKINFSHYEILTTIGGFVNEENILFIIRLVCDFWV